MITFKPSKQIEFGLIGICNPYSIVVPTQLEILQEHYV